MKLNTKAGTGSNLALLCQKVSTNISFQNLNNVKLAVGPSSFETCYWLEISNKNLKNFYSCAPTFNV